VEQPPSWDPGPATGGEEPPADAAPPPHPIRLVVTDDRHRSRLTVFFRLLLAIPHLLWALFWSIAAFFAAIGGWFVALFAGRLPLGLHRFLAAYVRYITHLYAYLYLAANPYPGFAGDPGYPVDLEIDGPERQSRWKIGFRIVLALPAILIMTALVGWPSAGGGSSQQQQDGEWAAGGSAAGVAVLVAFLAWFAILVRGVMPQGFRDLVAYALRYGAQTGAYLLLLTDRYPSTDPFEPPPPEPAPARPVRIVIDDDCRRSRLTVFFRLPLTFPHLVWLLLWSVAAVVVAILNWFATLFAGRSPSAFHRFLARYLRYYVHVYAFLSLAANPFPGFTGEPDRYPVDLEIDGRERQNRWITGFRWILDVPAWLVAASLGSLLFSVAFLGWFAALFTGRMPLGFRNANAFVLRYWAQTNAYGFLLLTDRYPYSGPAERRVEPEPPAAPAALAGPPPEPGAGLAPA
jgi:hypothetical protein